MSIVMHSSGFTSNSLHQTHLPEIISMSCLSQLKLCLPSIHETASQFSNQLMQKNQSFQQNYLPLFNPNICCSTGTKDQSLRHELT